MHSRSINILSPFSCRKSPVILPKDSHMSLLLTCHHHEQVSHQGHHLMKGAIKTGGLWTLGGKSLINSVLHRCVTAANCKGRWKINVWWNSHQNTSKPALLLCMWGLMYLVPSLSPPDAPEEDKQRTNGGPLCLAA